MSQRKIIVFGNQKGGTGKSTLAMHLAVSLLQNGYKVATVDVDARQGTLSRYIENRERTRRNYPEILVPFHKKIFASNAELIDDRKRENIENVNNTIQSLYNDYDYIILDTPGSDSTLSKITHSFADIIITPMNESFLDLDLLVKLSDSVSANNLIPSSYAEIVWNQKKEKALRDKGSIDWIVLVNRMSSIISKNRRELDKILMALSRRIGFRLGKGFKERVIFRELFLSGLTLLDKHITGGQMSLSHIAARQELNDLLRILDISKKK